LLVKAFLFLVRYVRYWFQATNQHGIHSPFVFDLYNRTIHSTGYFYAFDRIERLRQILLQSKKKIAVIDFGTGKSETRSLAHIAAHASKSKKHGQLLFRMAHSFQPDTIIEMGTSLGISTAYLASFHSACKVITLEGCPETAAIAQSNFKWMGLKNIAQRVGEFDGTLSSLIKSSALPHLHTLFFIDGNHKKEPTLRYFNELLKIANEHSIFIFDDIHWSADMEAAWITIQQHEKVTVTIDLFFVGIVFFRKEQAKENFILK
jgi:predicted O-methyltransferase YrrM